MKELPSDPGKMFFWTAGGICRIYEIGIFSSAAILSIQQEYTERKMDKMCLLKRFLTVFGLSNYELPHSW
jgi:hypothetical protein